MAVSLFLRILWRFRQSVIILLTPLLFLPLPLIGQTQAASCGYVICIMAVYWTTEACPLAVTSLLPVILFPLFGIQTTDEVSMSYMRQTSMLLVGTFVLCIAIEEWNLHKRFALRILMLCGSSPMWIMAGLMFVAAVLSMWLSNTSTVALMHPIAMAVFNEITETQKQNENEDNGSDECNQPSNVKEENDLVKCVNSQEISKSEQDVSENEAINLKKALLLAVTYASNIGGISTTVGTPTNLLSIGIIATLYGEEAASNLGFLSWMAFGVPMAIVCLFITWVWLQLRFFGIRQFRKKSNVNANKAVQQVIRKNYEALPQMSFGEKCVMMHFFVLILLWLTRDSNFFQGWRNLFLRGYVHDSTASVVIGVSLFLFPSKSTSFSWLWKWNRSSDDNQDAQFHPSTALMTWNAFQRRFPWDILILLGSGFALAKGCVVSGLSKWFGFQLLVLNGASTWIILLIVSLTISILTEFTSNAATTSIFLPIMLKMGAELQINPIAILLTVAVSCSFAFSLPIATPPNALAFTFGSLRIVDMLTAGIVLNFACVMMLNIFIHLTGAHIFHLDVMPEWAMNITNVTNITSSP